MLSGSYLICNNTLIISNNIFFFKIKVLEYHFFLFLILSFLKTLSKLNENLDIIHIFHRNSRTHHESTTYYNITQTRLQFTPLKIYYEVYSLSLSPPIQGSLENIEKKNCIFEIIMIKKLFTIFQKSISLLTFFFTKTMTSCFLVKL